MRPAMCKGASVSKFLRRTAADRSRRTLLAVERLDDVIGAVRTDAGVAGRSGARDLRTISTVADDLRSYRLTNRRYLDFVPTTTTR
jgi:hypothetical protein